MTLGVLTSTVPAALIDTVLTATGRHSARQRQLPARLVVYYVMALALYAQASYGEVLRCLLEGVRWLCLGGSGLRMAGKPAITKARTRLGVAPLKELFLRVAGPVARSGMPGAWYRGRRLVAIDGTTVDLADTPELETRFGRPPASRGTSAFPQLRLLTLVETGTHAILAAAFDRYTVSEHRLAPALFGHLRVGMLCLADRGFLGFALWRTAAATGADLLWRARTKQQRLPCHQRLADASYLSHLYPSTDHRRRDKGGITVRVVDSRLDGVPGTEPLYRLVTTLLDPKAAPAAELAALYHERWVVEVTFEEVRRHLGVESQRQWSDRAIARTTPALLALFSLVTLWAQELARDGRLPPRRAAWYPKSHLTFSDALAAVRRQLWTNGLFTTSNHSRDLLEISAPLANRLLDVTCFPA